MGKKRDTFGDEVRQAIRAVTRLAPLIRRRKKAAAKACETLLSATPEEREALMEDARAANVRSRPVVEELIRRIQREVFRDPTRAEELGAVTADLLWHLPRTPEAVGGERGWQDLSARLWAHRANVARVRCAWQEAHTRFRLAYRGFEEGSGDPQLEAEIFFLHASLYKDGRHHQQALDCLRKAELIYKSLRSSSAVGKTLLKRAAVFREIDSHREALTTHLEACKLLDGFEEPELTAGAWSNLAVHLCDLGDPCRAETVLEETEHLFRLCDRRSTIHLNRSWARAMAAHGLRRHEDAETLYLKTRLGFHRMSDPYNEALVALDLATLYAEQNRFEDLAAIAEETYAGLRDQQLHPEAERALNLFVEAARRREAAVEIIRAAAEQLGRRRSCSRGAR